MNSKKAFSCAVLLRALADETRLNVVRELMSGPRHVNEFTCGTRVPQALFSHHLAVLRKSGIVKAKRDGKAVLYSLSIEMERGKSNKRLMLGCCSIAFE